MKRMAATARSNMGKDDSTTHAEACSDKVRQHLHGLHRDSDHNKGYQCSTRQRNPRPVTSSRVGEPSYRAQEHTGSALHATVSRHTGRLAWPPGTSRHSALSLLPKALGLSAASTCLKPAKREARRRHWPSAVGPRGSVTATPAWAVQLSAICAPGLMLPHAAFLLELLQKRCDGARGGVNGASSVR